MKRRHIPFVCVCVCASRVGWVVIKCLKSSCMHFDDQCASLFQAEPHASIRMRCLPRGDLIC